MTLYRYTFPIENYEGNDTYDQAVYFESEYCPTKQQVIEALEKIDREQQEDSRGTPYEGWPSYASQCLKAISQLTNMFPSCTGSYIKNSERCDTEFGQRSLSCDVVVPIVIRS